MKNIISIKIFAALLMGFTLAFTASAQNRYGGSYARSVDLFYAEDYAGAVNEFEKAESDKESNEVTSKNQTEINSTQDSGAKPGGGLWKATISNGYKGQTLSFRVSADGKIISGVAFKGYLICRGSRIEDTQLAPLKNIVITDDSFADKQLYEGQIRIDFNGTFTSATDASGTYRVMSSTDSDTYELKWTASRAVN
jgi:hypothetical protein